MATIDLGAATFDDTVLGNDIVLLDFWAAWCGPCRSFAPTYEASSEKHPDIVFGKVDTEKEQQLSAAAGIQSIPTLMAFRDKVLVFSQAGALPPAALEELIQSIKALDMVEVHKKMADANADATTAATNESTEIGNN
jgi:thioredoxin 1